MKDSQPAEAGVLVANKYIKANNERFSTSKTSKVAAGKYIKANNERFSTLDKPSYRME